MVSDLFFVDKTMFRHKMFGRGESSFQQTPSDIEILKDIALPRFWGEW
jgi:hypothetical protein